MYGIGEFVDKVSDNAIITTGGVSAGSVSEALRMPHELAVFIAVTVGILVRVLLEHSWRHHEQIVKRQRDARRKARLTRCPPKSRLEAAA